MRAHRRRGSLLLLFLAISSVFGFSADVTVVFKDGKTLRLNQAAFFESPGLLEEDGAPVSFRTAPSNPDLSKYAKSHTKLGIVGGVYYYVPWNEIKAITILDGKKPDEWNNPVKLKMRDGKLIKATIVLNGWSPCVVGNTKNGGPVEEYHSALNTTDKNCSISISKLAEITVVEAVR